MCGISGIMGSTDIPGVLDRMNRAQAHRGPDDSGTWHDSFVGLAQRRLSIIDLSSGGHQPMSDPSGRFTLTFNGEIYNFEEVRAELTRRGFQPIWKTRSDTEVLLYAFIHLGPACLDLLNGMFAFGVWDNQRKRLFLARDRMGIKPLYYYHDAGHFVFASEVRALLASGHVPRELDPEGLDDYLRYQTVHAPKTLLRGVYMLLPGTFAELDLEGDRPGSLHHSVYWQLGQGHLLVSEVSAEEAQHRVRHLLTESVRRRLVADVPFGAFLSGGIDSSAVVALMAQVSTQPVRTFSVVFDEEEFSEARYARMVAERYGTQHTEIRLQPEDFKNLLPLALDAMDHPSGDGPNTYVVSKVTREAGITMALSGLGGDEVFAGYDVFHRAQRLERLSWLGNIPALLRRPAGEVLRLARGGVAGDKLAELFAAPNWSFGKTYPLVRAVQQDAMLMRWKRGGHLHANRVEALAAWAERAYPGANQLLSRVSVAEMTSYMQNVLLRDTDQMSMAVALEVRVPFLDYTLVEYVMRLSDALKQPTTPKRLLVSALSDLLPEAVVNRPKMGFTLPWKHWMKNDLKTFCGDHLRALEQREYIVPGTMTDLWRRFLADDPRVTWSRIWYLVVLEHWLQRHVR